MGIPKDQKPAEKFRATPQRKITKEMFLARSFTVQPLVVPELPKKRVPDLMNTFRDMVLGRETQQMFANMAFVAPRAAFKPWTLADIMPEKMPQPPQQSFEERHPDRPIYHAPSHTSRIFNPTSLRHIADRVVGICEGERLDALLCCGHSGLLLAGAVSALCGIPVFAARKVSEMPVAGSQGLRINGIAPHGPAKRWAWIDDHISSGGTFQHSRILARDARLVASAIPVLFILYEGHGTYFMTEDNYIGYRQGWEPESQTPGVVEVRATKV